MKRLINIYFLAIAALFAASCSLHEDTANVATKKDVLFIIADWNAKVECLEIPRVTGKFGIGLQNKEGQRLTGFCQEKALVVGNTFFQQHKIRLYK